MTQATRIPISDSAPPQGVRVVIGIRYTIPPQKSPVPIATDALGNVMAEVVPYADGHLRGFVVRERATGPIPRYRDSAAVYPSQGAAEDAYWYDADARVYAELERIEWDAWETAVKVAE